MEPINPIYLSLANATPQQMARAGTGVIGAESAYNEIQRKRQLEEEARARAVQQAQLAFQQNQLQDKRNTEGLGTIASLGGMALGAGLGKNLASAAMGATLGSNLFGSSNVIGNALGTVNDLANNSFWKNKKAEAFGPSLEEISNPPKYR